MIARATSAVAIGVAIVLMALPQPGLAQAPRATVAMPRDSLLGCAVRIAIAAGFRQVPGARPDRIGMMRPRDSGGDSYPLDALRLAFAPPDASGATRLDLRVTTFLVSRATGLNQEEIAPGRALIALTDSIRVRCR